MDNSVAVVEPHWDRLIEQISPTVKAAVGLGLKPLDDNIVGVWKGGDLRRSLDLYFRFNGATVLISAYEQDWNIGQVEVSILGAAQGDDIPRPVIGCAG